MGFSESYQGGMGQQFSQESGLLIPLSEAVRGATVPECTWLRAWWLIAKLFRDKSVFRDDLNVHLYIRGSELNKLPCESPVLFIVSSCWC